MSQEMNVKRLSVTPTRDSLLEVSEFLDVCLEEWDVPMKAGFQVKVVADEVYSNIVFYSGATAGEVVVTDLADEVRLLFVDNGVSYNPLDAEDPDVTAAAEDRDVGGLGTFMVKRMAKEVTYERVGEENRLTVIMSKSAQKKNLSVEDV